MNESVGWRKGRLILMMCITFVLGPVVCHGQASSGAFGTMSSATGKTITIDGRIALASLVTITDGHLLKMRNEFQAIAARQEVVAGDWKKIKPLLKRIGDRTVPASLWFALPSGKYWTVDKDLEKANLKDRPYFPRLLAGKPVVGALVVGRSSGRNAAIVAVPVLRNNQVVGALGASIFLDRLSALVREEMELPADTIFFSFDAEPLLALVWDPGLIFNRPKELGPEVDEAFREMLTKEQGMVTYTFRGKTRDVLFKKSKITDWWYVLGRVRD